MKTNCHNCGRVADCSLCWEVQSGQKKDLKLICERCVFMYGYKFVAFILGQK